MTREFILECDFHIDMFIMAHEVVPEYIMV